MEILLLAAFLGLLPALIASKKGRNFGKWYLYGALLFIVALVHAILIDDRKSCHRCGEKIMSNALVCHYCNSEQRGIENMDDYTEQKREKMAEVVNRSS